MASIDLEKKLHVTADFVKDLQRDLKKMTLIYKSIPTSEEKDPGGKIFLEAENLFWQFADNLKDVVEEQIIDSKIHDDNVWSETNLREKVAALSLALTQGGTAKGAYMFPHLRLGDVRSPPNYFQLEKVRETNIRRYQGAARDFMVALGEWIDHMQRQEKTTERGARVERTTIAGVQILIKRVNEDTWKKNWGETIEQTLAQVLQPLETHLNRVRKLGFGEALRGLMITLDFNKNDQYQGFYSHGSGRGKDNDLLVITPWGMSDKQGEFTIVHEIGHRFWYRNVSSNGRAAWLAAFKGKESTAVTKESVALWAETVVSTGVDYMDTKTKKKVLDNLLNSGLDRHTKAHLLLIEDKAPSYSGESLDSYKIKISHLVGQMTPLEKVSDYAETKPEEWFAETFRVYVTEGPSKVGPETRQLFKEVCETSGSRISGRAEVVKALRAAADALEGSSPRAPSSRRSGR